jgi:predicted GNAT family acetyltransferase
MYYQRPRPVRGKFSTAERGKMNKKAKEMLVRQGRSHAALVYAGKIPVGWCQYGPREELPRIDAGRNYKKMDPLPGDKKLWRITCFFVDKDYRGQGVARTALRGALESIRKQGGESSKRIRSSPRTCQRSRSGCGSDHPACFGENGSSRLPRSERAIT